ncbi:MAG: tetratricopeptide repeat protein [Phycisphaerales bacterium]
MTLPVHARILAVLVAVAAPLAGCDGTLHSQKVRSEARDRFDKAGAQIAYDQARQSFHSGQFEDALGHVDRAVGRFPKESSYHLLRGRILHEMTRVSDARDAFRTASELDPSKAEPHYFLGIIHQRWREHEEALSCYAKASEIDPSKLHFVAAEIELMTVMGRHDAAEARLASVERQFEFSPVVDRLRADVAKMKGDHERCADLLERAMVRETSSPDQLEELAFARYSKGDWAGSLSTLEDPALAKKLSRPDLARLRARNLILLGRSAEARDVLLAILSEPDPEGRTAILLGHAAWRVGDWGRVTECGKSLVKRQPTLAEGYMFLGAAAHASGRLDESLAMFEQAVAREPDREVAQRLLADVGARIAGRTPAPAAASAGALRSDAP